MLTFTEIDLTFGSPGNDFKQVGFPAAQEYLRKRGIPPEDAAAMGLRIVPAQQLKEMTLKGSWRGGYDDRLAIVFPHHDGTGGRLDWWSARFVSTGPKAVHSFAHLVDAYQQKMLCPPGVPPHAYLPENCEWKFEKGAKVYIHESAIKAFNGGKYGGMHVGLNGVWGWTSKNHDIALVGELRNFPWKTKELVPVIVFDSDYDTNKLVSLAIAKLGAKIQELTGRVARHIPLPKAPDGSNWGFDDFCQAHTTEQVREYLESDGVEVDVGDLTLMRLRLNTEVCVVKSLGRIAVQETGVLMNRAVFTDVNYADYLAQVEDGESLKMVSGPKNWLTWDGRTSVNELTYMPGREKIADGNLNIWRGMGLEPAEGDVGMWLSLLEKNVTDPVLRKWFIQWMAYPLQNLGAKLNTFVHLFGPPGSGKQAVIHPLMRIYGEANAIVIGKEQIESNFNSIYANKQFINIDEIHGGAGATAVTITNRIKRIVTSEVMTVNTKGQPEYEVPNCAQLVTTSNYSDSIKLDDDDRRAAVIRFGERGAGYDKAFWEGYFQWVNGDGAEAVYDYLLRVDMDGFDPKGWAPMTEDKVEVTRATRRVDEQWVNTLWEDPDQVLTPILAQRCLMTGPELAQFCYGDDPGGVTPSKVNVLGIRMASAGFPKIEIKTGGKKVRYWIIRRRDEQWDSKKAQSHLKVHGGKVAG